MSSTRPRHWAQINEVTFVAGIRFLFLIYRVMGRLPVALILYPVALFYCLISGYARAASRAYLTRVLGTDRAAVHPVSAAMVFRHFLAFADGILDSMIAWSAPQKIRIARHEQRVLTDPLESGRGGLIITAHIGNVSVCRGLATERKDMRLNVLVHTKHAESFNQLLKDVNPESATRLIEVTDLSVDTAMLLSERVSKGEFVVIAGDRIPVSPDPRVVMAPFLGEAAAFPAGPYVLASVLRCPTYLLFCVKQGDTYHVHYELFRESIRLPRNGRELFLTELAEAYAARLAHYCTLAPLQWFNFFDFWAPPCAVPTDASRQ